MASELKTWMLAIHVALVLSMDFESSHRKSMCVRSLPNPPCQNGAEELYWEQVALRAKWVLAHCYQTVAVVSIIPMKDYDSFEGFFYYYEVTVVPITPLPSVEPC